MGSSNVSTKAIVISLLGSGLRMICQKTAIAKASAATASNAPA